MSNALPLRITAAACAVAITACSVDDGIDWRAEGRSIGRGLQEQGSRPTADACLRAIEAYERDVGLPSSDDGRRAMQEGCEDAADNEARPTP